MVIIGLASGVFWPFLWILAYFGPFLRLASREILASGVFWPFLWRLAYFGLFLRRYNFYFHVYVLRCMYKNHKNGYFCINRLQLNPNPNPNPLWEQCPYHYHTGNKCPYDTGNKCPYDTGNKSWSRLIQKYPKMSSSLVHWNDSLLHQDQAQDEVSPLSAVSCLYIYCVVLSKTDQKNLNKLPS